MPSKSLVIPPADPSAIGPLYTTQEVADLLRVSPRTVQTWIKAGELVAVRYGRQLRIRHTDLAAFGTVSSGPRPAAEGPDAG
jgi:excisionase family DNA binding protein